MPTQHFIKRKSLRAHGLPTSMPWNQSARSKHGSQNFSSSRRTMRKQPGASSAVIATSAAASEYYVNCGRSEQGSLESVQTADDGMQLGDEVGPTKSMPADATSMAKPKLSHPELNPPGMSDEFIQKIVGIVLKSKSNGNPLRPSAIVAIIQCDEDCPANLNLEQLNDFAHRTLKPIIDGVDPRAWHASRRRRINNGASNIKQNKRKGEEILEATSVLFKPSVDGNKECEKKKPPDDLQLLRDEVVPTKCGTSGGEEKSEVTSALCRSGSSDCNKECEEGKTPLQNMNITSPAANSSIGKNGVMDAKAVCPPDRDFAFVRQSKKAGSANNHQAVTGAIQNILASVQVSSADEDQIQLGQLCSKLEQMKENNKATLHSWDIGAEGIPASSPIRKKAHMSSSFYGTKMNESKDAKQRSIKMISGQLGELKPYKKKHGNGSVSKDAKQRPKKSVSRRLVALEAYKEEHGHVNVKMKEDKSLYQFCAQIKYERRHPKKKKSRLTSEDILSLNALGFNWNPTYIKFEERLEELRLYKKKHGHIKVEGGRGRKYSSLANFCHTVRNAESNNGTKLTDDRIAALDALGFDWRS